MLPLFERASVIHAHWCSARQSPRTSLIVLSSRCRLVNYSMKYSLVNWMCQWWGVLSSSPQISAPSVTCSSGSCVFVVQFNETQISPLIKVVKGTSRIKNNLNYCRFFLPTLLPKITKVTDWMLHLKGLLTGLESCLFGSGHDSSAKFGWTVLFIRCS